VDAFARRTHGTCGTATHQVAAARARHSLLVDFEGEGTPASVQNAAGRSGTGKKTILDGCRAKRPRTGWRSASVGPPQDPTHDLIGACPSFTAGRIVGGDRRFHSGPLLCVKVIVRKRPFGSRPQAVVSSARPMIHGRAIPTPGGGLWFCRRGSGRGMPARGRRTTGWRKNTCCRHRAH